MQALVGDLPEGLTVSEDEKELTLENVDISSDDSEYTKMSGKVSRREFWMKADLTFEGGPVKSIQFELENYGSDDPTNVSVTVNGKIVEIDTTNL